MEESDIKEKIKAMIRDDKENQEITHEIVNSMPMESGNNRKLSDMQLYDVRELFVYCILNNQTRRQSYNMIAEYLDQLGIVVGEDISERQIVRLYDESKKALLERSLSNIDKEKSRYVQAVYRLALKCEQSNDFGNALKALKEIADVAGVFDSKDESKITINFTPASPKEKAEDSE